MTGTRGWRWWLGTFLWLLLLALLPWWLGLPLLLAIAAALMVSAERLGGHAQRLRHGLRWGLAAVLFALQWALGGDAFALGVALLAALVGYTVLAGLEAWLDRDRRRAPSQPEHAAEWPQLALAPIGPAAAIIELQPPCWLDAGADVVEPGGGVVDYRAQTYRFADGLTLAGGGPDCCFSPDGAWFAARLANAGGLLLCDRGRHRVHRLRGWQLYGWHAAQPWLVRDERNAPVPLKDVLGQPER